MAEDDAPKTGRERVRELGRMARHNAAEYELGTVYGLMAVSEAVLVLADALQAHRGPVKGSTRPLPPAKLTGFTPCRVCGHVRDMHHENVGACRSASCPCNGFVGPDGG